MEILAYTPGRAREVTDLFHDAVHAIDPALYSPAQKEAWAPTPPDYDLWRERLADKVPWLALIDGVVACFMEMDPDGHIDCVYTHPRFQGTGVASALYRHIEQLARERKMQWLYVEASIVARPFFEHHGFAVLRENRVERRGQILRNYAMEKCLPGGNRVVSPR